MFEEIEFDVISAISEKASPDLSRSQYSLVSAGDLTAGAVQLWKGLPEEVKYDAALAPFRLYYEKEHAAYLIHNTISQEVNMLCRALSLPTTDLITAGSERTFFFTLARHSDYRVPDGNFDNSFRSNNSAKKQRLPFVNSAPHLNNNPPIIRNDAILSTDNTKDEPSQEKILETEVDNTRKSKIVQARHYIKISLLLACWIFFTVTFMMYNEKEVVTRNSSLNAGEIKSYTVQSSDDKLTLMLTLTGPFLTEHEEKGLNSSLFDNGAKMEVWVERLDTKSLKSLGYSQSNADSKQISETWKILLQGDNLDFNQGEERTKLLKVEPAYSGNVSNAFAVKLKTNSNQTVPFRMSYSVNPLENSTGVIYAVLLLCGLYFLIIFEVVNRTMASVIMSTTSLAVLAVAGERPSLSEVISWMDEETLLLLFSMMLLVAIMAETGLFDYLAVFTFEVTKGKIWPLITLLCVITASLSTVLDNVTTVLLMTPVTIRLCEVMDMDPIPVLLSMVFYSNIGGTATPVGDPPNVIIASNKAVIDAGINFTNFTIHMTLGILLVSLQTYFQLRFTYRNTKKLRLNEPRDIQDLRQQISIWRRAAASLPHLSRDEQVVRERLDKKVRKLTAQLDVMIKERKKWACPKDSFKSTLADMKEKYKIRDRSLLIKASIATGFVVFVFFLHSIPELNRVSLGWTALLGAILLLTLADREDLESILHRVEWSTLLFFAALFVLMEALSKLGLIEFIGGLTESVILKVDENARLAVALLLILWVSGITSAFVDNIPLTTMMVRVVTSLGTNPSLGLPLAPLIWALSFGACLGGNGTLIGASANVVCAGVAEQHGYKFTFVHFLKIGFPIMIGHLVVASLYLIICHCLFTWH